MLLKLGIHLAIDSNYRHIPYSYCRYIHTSLHAEVCVRHVNFLPIMRDMF